MGMTALSSRRTVYPCLSCSLQKVYQLSLHNFRLRCECYLMALTQWTLHETLCVPIVWEGFSQFVKRSSLVSPYLGATRTPLMLNLTLFSHFLYIYTAWWTI